MKHDRKCSKGHLTASSIADYCTKCGEKLVKNIFPECINGHLMLDTEEYCDRCGKKKKE